MRAVDEVWNRACAEAGAEERHHVSNRPAVDERVGLPVYAFPPVFGATEHLSDSQVPALLADFRVEDDDGPLDQRQPRQLAADTTVDQVDWPWPDFHCRATAACSSAVSAPPEL